MSETLGTEEERWAKVILAKISPSFALKHYFEVIGRIGWITFDLKREIFTRPELKNNIENWLGDLELGHPYRPLKVRSMQVMNEVIDQLLSISLLIEERGFLKKSDDFGRFTSLLRWVMSSAERRVCWVIFHFHAKGIKVFKTDDLLDFLSYSELNCRNELPELTIWKPVTEPSAVYNLRGRRVRVLERKGDAWIIVDKPLSSRRPLLLMDLWDRLGLVVSMLAKTKELCTTDEVLSLLRSLERQAVERALSRIHIKSVENRWMVDAKLVNEPNGILDRLKLRKVLQVKLGIRNPKWLRFVRVESRDIVDGDPVKYLQYVLDEVFNLDKSSTNIKDFQKDCREILVRWNEKLYPFGIELELRRASPFGYSPDAKRFAIRIRRHHREELRGSLMDRYSRIQVCRMPESRGTSILSVLSDYSRPDELLNYLGDKRSGYYSKLENSYGKIILFLNWWRKELEELVGRNPDYDRLFLYSAGFGEITNSLIAAFLSAYNGFFRSAFKDLREIIEWLALTVFLDSMQIRYVFEGYRLPRQLYHEAIESGDWHKALEGRIDIARTIKSPDEIKKGVIARLYEPNKGIIEGLGVRKEDFVDEVVKHMSLPIFVVTTSDISCPKHAGKRVYCIPCKEIGNYLGFELARLLAMMKEGKDFQPWLRLEDMKRLVDIFGQIEFQVNTCCTFSSPEKEICGADADMESLFAIRVPTTNVLLYLAGKRLNLPDIVVKEITDRYNEYCCLVHPYPQTMQYSPFTAGDEVDLWVSELERLILLLNEAFCRFFTFVRSGFDEKLIGKKIEVCGRCRFAESSFKTLDREIIKRKHWLKQRGTMPK